MYSWHVNNKIRTNLILIIFILIYPVLCKLDESDSDTESFRCPKVSALVRHFNRELVTLAYPPKLLHTTDENQYVLQSKRLYCRCN